MRVVIGMDFEPQHTSMHDTMTYPWLGTPDEVCTCDACWTYAAAVTVVRLIAYS